MADNTPFHQMIDQNDELIRILIRWCEINSGTGNLDGLARMRAELGKAFDLLGESAELIDLPKADRIDERGQHVSFEVGPAMRWTRRMDREHTVFLCIHMDTVYGADHPFQSCRYSDNDRIVGPGVADAKGGLLVMLAGLAAFEKTPEADRIGWEVYVNADEEIGSPGSAGFFQEAAKRHRFGLLYEPTLPDGTMVHRRKGSGGYTLKVQGVSAHAGREFEKGRNAIVELSRLVGELHALNGQPDGTLLNVARIDGGGPINVVPELALARMNVRVSDEEAAEWLESALQNVVARAQDTVSADPQRSGFQYELSGKITSPPKCPDDRIREIEEWIELAGTEIGQMIRWKDTGGSCDGNKLWAGGLPNVDTMGVRGGNIHSPDEFVILPSLTERAQLTANVLHRFASQTPG